MAGDVSATGAELGLAASVGKARVVDVWLVRQRHNVGEREQGLHCDGCASNARSQICDDDTGRPAAVLKSC